MPLSSIRNFSAELTLARTSRSVASIEGEVDDAIVAIVQTCQNKNKYHEQIDMRKIGLRGWASSPTNLPGLEGKQSTNPNSAYATILLEQQTLAVRHAPLRNCNAFEVSTSHANRPLCYHSNLVRLRVVHATGTTPTSIMIAPNYTDIKYAVIMSSDHCATTASRSSLT